VLLAASTFFKLISQSLRFLPSMTATRLGCRTLDESIFNKATVTLRFPCYFSCRSAVGIVNLADAERLLPAPLGLSGQHNGLAKEFPDPSRRATDTTSIPWLLKLTMRSGPSRTAMPFLIPINSHIDEPMGIFP